MHSWLSVVTVKSLLRRSGWCHFLLMAGVTGSASHQSGSCHLIDDHCPSSHQEVEVCVLEAVESVWLAGRSAVGPEWSGSSYHGALRQQWQPRALTDSGHYHLLSAPFASGQEHLTLPVVTKCCRTAGSKVKYSSSRSGGFPLHQR